MPPKKINTKIEESDENNDTSEYESSEENIHNEVENKVKVTKEKKEKKELKTVTELCDIYNNIHKQIQEKRTIIISHEKEISDLEKQLKGILSQINTSHMNEIKNIKKEHKISKRQGNPTGGFNKVILVPEPLRKLLKLEKNTELTRPQVIHLFHEELKNRGLKKGQDATLDKKIVKDLGIDKSYENTEISFGEFQTFIAKFYNENKEDKTVTI